jgi:hypothetical protein
MRLTTWQKSCALFDLDPGLAGQLANFSVLQLVAVRRRALNQTTNSLGIPLIPLAQGTWLAAWPTRVKDLRLLLRRRDTTPREIC